MEKIIEKDGHKYWLIRLDQDELFARLSENSAYREHSMENGGSPYVLLEDDRVMAGTLVENAVAGLWAKLARMGKQVGNALRYSEDSVQITLAVTGNHDDNMIFVLGNLISRFIEAWVLRQWFDRNGATGEMVKCESEAMAVLDGIVSTIHYRKKAVRRPLDPVL